MADNDWLITRGDLAVVDENQDAREMAPYRRVVEYDWENATALVEVGDGELETWDVEPSSMPSQVQDALTSEPVTHMLCYNLDTWIVIRLALRDGCPYVDEGTDNAARVAERRQLRVFPPGVLKRRVQSLSQGETR